MARQSTSAIPLATEEEFFIRRFAECNPGLSEREREIFDLFSDVVKQLSVNIGFTREIIKSGIRFYCPAQTCVFPSMTLVLDASGIVGSVGEKIIVAVSFNEDVVPFAEQLTAPLRNAFLKV